MKKLINLTLSLLHYCKRKGDWEPDLTEPVITNLLEAISTHPDFGNVFDVDTAYTVILIGLSHVEEQVPQKFSDNDAIDFIEQFKRNLRANADDHWIIVPLRHATLSSSIAFNNFHFITGSRDDKITLLRDLCQITTKAAHDRANHTEKSRSQGFFEHPLLAINVRHQTGYVSRIAHSFAYGSIVALEALYWACVYPIHPKSIFNHNVSHPTKHLAVWAQDNWRCRHESLNFHNACRLNLDWLSNKEFQDQFYNVFNYLIAKRSADGLSKRFYKSIRFYGKSIATQEIKDRYDGLGVTILYLMISAESILLDGDSEKRSRLTALLPRLAPLSDVSMEQCARAIDWAYRARSDYVHAGNETYPDWDEDFNDGENQQKAIIVQRMVAKLIVDSPQHIEIAKSTCESDPVSAWIKLLRLQWTKILYGTE